MARPVRDAKLETKSSKRTSSPEPSTLLENIGAGQTSPRLSQKSKDQPGTWLARRYVGKQRYRIAPLDIADDFEHCAISYEEAQRLAYEHRFAIEEHKVRIGQALPVA